MYTLEAFCRQPSQTWYADSGWGLISGLSTSREKAYIAPTDAPFAPGSFEGELLRCRGGRAEESTKTVGGTGIPLDSCTDGQAETRSSGELASSGQRTATASASPILIPRDAYGI
ncbi:hypothetical protein ABBQ38_000671 [Trebouxia sp. C0009 RCD-2024]